jgi:hypothetical protein
MSATTRYVDSFRGVPKKQIYFCGYWLHQRNDYPAFREAEIAEYAEAQSA